MAEKLGSYKYCLVPKCMNTNRSAPEKYFFPVPRHNKMRKRWCHAMKRVDREPLSYKTSLHCCQDHFDIEYDVENYVKFKLIGGRMILKSGVLPHMFNCQLHDETNSDSGDTIDNHLLPIQKQIDPLELVACDLRENEIDDIKHINELNELNRDEFNYISRGGCGLKGVKKIRKKIIIRI